MIVNETCSSKVEEDFRAENGSICSPAHRYHEPEIELFRQQDQDGYIIQNFW